MGPRKVKGEDRHSSRDIVELRGDAHAVRFDRVGILYQPRLPQAKTLAEDLSKALSRSGSSVWICSAWQEEQLDALIQGTGSLLSVGGDGTILRTARLAAASSIPILGIKMGRLGFLAELEGDEVLDRLPCLIKGQIWIDERTMLQADVIPAEGCAKGEGSPSHTFHALNDVVVGRGGMSRPIYVETEIDGESLNTYKADGVIVATATGSTGYSLSTGGPILHPQSTELVLKPVSPHLSLSSALVLPASSIVSLRVHTDQTAMLSVDGQVDLTLDTGDLVKVKISPYKARFLRFRSPPRFYSSLMQRLQWHK